ncbi:hypothetical protein D0469_17290 [Peribacillus saganii]|uniref:Uncharacterized protein n=1 Tax=Peribacillus saganii TaxID=2303992 RepID=A0A372LJ11_9BACI|nr:CBO0543 family protein [Peribacillus saganii]RFU66387.1 hypothetical protein D0469_17290 [Peribacillus saganii]
MRLHDESRNTEHFYQQVAQINEKYFEFWREHTFLQWEWWLSVGLSIIPWIIWWKYINKKSTARYMSAAFFIIIISSWLDFFGVVNGLWYYSGIVIPTIPSYVPWDLCLIPVTMTLFMQFKPHVSSIKKAIVYASLVAFVGEPVFDWIGLYEIVNWKHIYSFPIYAIIYLTADWITKRKSFGPVQ